MGTLTRKQLRQLIARNCLGSEFVNSDASAGGSVRVLEDNTLRGGDGDYRGKWMLFTSGTNLNHEARVTLHHATNHELQFEPVAAAATVAADTYEMFGEWLSASAIHDAINQALTEVAGAVYDDEESLLFHGDYKTTRWTLPTEMDMVRRIFYRYSVTSRLIHNCDSVWDETTDADFTQSVQTYDKQQGGASLRLVIAAGASANDKITENISSTDLSQCTYLEFWIKSTVALTAGQAHILLDDTAACASPVETLAVPALSANIWIFCRVALANPALDTAIISVGYRYTTDIGAVTIFLDDIKAVAADTAQWGQLPHHLWRIDPEGRDVVLTGDGLDRVGYHLVKLVGGSNPTRMSADTDVADINEDFIIARATSLLLMPGGGTLPNDPDGRRAMALSAYWVRQADMAKQRFPMLMGARRVG